jgi:hypothetical protein
MEVVKRCAVCGHKDIWMTEDGEETCAGCREEIEREEVN